MVLPARSRELMLASGAGQLILTIDLREKCLMLYPLPEWEKVQTTLTGLANVRSDIRLVQRLLIGHATDGDLDSQGSSVDTESAARICAAEKTSGASRPRQQD